MKNSSEVFVQKLGQDRYCFTYFATRALAEGSGRFQFFAELRGKRSVNFGAHPHHIGFVVTPTKASGPGRRNAL